MKEKIRLDALLVERGLATGRDRAKAMIMAGEVWLEGEKALKAGTEVGPDSRVEVRGDTLPYVSRGGLKLERAMEAFDPPIQGKICADIGASTGGFTDCMLQQGAERVYAVDVGYGQLDWRLRSDPRVVTLERTNARHLTREQIPQPLGFVSVDVSFISLSLILPAVYPLMEAGAHAVCLIKPQFEAGREQVGKKGVVRDPEVHRQVIQKIADFALEQGFSPAGLTWSPIKGPKGNIEYLFHLLKEAGGSPVDPQRVAAVVENAHQALSQEE